MPYSLVYPLPLPYLRAISKLLLILKIVFFSIPLHPQDCVCFAFSIQIVNHVVPNPCFQWRVLPQGMVNSPTLCQKYVALIIDPIRGHFPTAYIVHYMDDLLIATKDLQQTLEIAQIVVAALQKRGFVIAPEKIQVQYPFMFFGFQLEPATVHSQKLAIQMSHLKTLNDFQKLLGDINWLCPYLKLTTGELKPLFDVLWGDFDPTSP